MINVGGCWRPKCCLSRQMLVNIRTHPSQLWRSCCAQGTTDAVTREPIRDFGSVLHFLLASAASAAQWHCQQTHTSQAPPNAPTHKKILGAQLEIMSMSNRISTLFAQKKVARLCPMECQTVDRRYNSATSTQPWVSKQWMMERVADGTSTRR